MRAPNRRRAPRRRVLSPAVDRFVDGLSRIEGPEIGSIFTPRPTERTPDVIVDVARASDLVSMRVEAYDLELVSGAKPILRASPDGGLLVVNLTYQHAAERAVYEGFVVLEPPAPPDPDPDPEDGPGARHNPPESARAAFPSRIVFDVAPEQEIAFSTEGILAAISVLPMVVHPLAAPRPAKVLPRPIDFLTLGENIIAVPTASGLVVTNPTVNTRAADTKTIRGLNQMMRDRRMARAIATRLGVVGARGLDVPAASESPTVNVGGSETAIGRITESGFLPGRVIVTPRPRRTLSRPPELLETAIEAPYRLIISPSQLGGWSHATEPVGATDAEHRVELWHTRLGVRQLTGEAGDTVVVNETSTHQRVIRAIWTRDRDINTDWKTKDPQPLNIPFRSSLNPADRHMLVRQSAETWIGKGGKRIGPDPVDVRKLYLSSVASWLDLIGSWDTDPYAEAGLKSIESWDHIAPMGRDQFVKVVYPGYLFPGGHRTSLVKLTERKMMDASPSVAGLFQKKFLVCKEPHRRYNDPAFPLTEIRIAPLVTPTIDDPLVADQSRFVPSINGVPFPFILHARDKEDRPVRLVTPLVWVSAEFVDAVQISDKWRPHANIVADGQKVAYAPVLKGGDTIAKTQILTLDGIPEVGKSEPRMVTADITIDAVQQVSDIGSVKIRYHDRYLQHQFKNGPNQNEGEVWAELAKLKAADPLDVEAANPVLLQFGAGSPTGSDQSGGFIQPNQSIAGLSRKKGTVGDLDAVAKGEFNPAAFLGNALPKLFGVVDLIDLLNALGLDDAPSLVSETLDRIESFLEDLQRAKDLMDEAATEAQRMLDMANAQAAPVAEFIQKAQDAKTAAATLKTLVDDAVNNVVNTITGSPGDIPTDLPGFLAALGTAVSEIRNVAPKLPPLIRNQLLKLADVLDVILQAADLIDDVVRFVNGIGSSSTLFSYRYDWTPKLKPWPDPNPILDLQEDSLVLAVEGRMSGKGEMGVDVLAEFRNFALILLPGEELVRFNFDHISFKAGSQGKAEVDVVLGDIEFVGYLGFIETIKNLIPFDGFSDPPYLDVTAEGLTAGFSIDLPNVAIGVFNLSNMSLGADVRVPFLGESVSVGFNFCTRERPFTLAVLFIGGGGFFGLRLAPDGLQLLELSLEAGAVLAVDFGVASGSISAMIGIYIRLEGDSGSLTGYFRLRGEVDVLGIISASIELYLELTYDFATGKMIGRATLTIKVEVLFFSASVTISAERRFKGSNGDPNFVDVMGLLPNGTSPAWSDYCLAFAGA